MARFGSLPSAAGTAAATTTAAKAAAPPPAPAKPAPAKPAPAARTSPPRTAAPAPKKPASPYSAESQEIFGTAPGTLSIEERFSPGQALSLAQAGLLSPADTAAVRAKEADVDFYLKKMEDVAKLRKEGVLGMQTEYPRRSGLEQDINEREMARSARIPLKVAPKPGMPAFEVYPNPSKVLGPGSEMQRVADFRELAKEYGMSYRDAARDVERGYANIATSMRDENFDRRKLPQLAQNQRELVRRLAESRANLREMGFLDDKEVNERFLK
jgi:hypothetical protein